MGALCDENQWNVLGVARSHLVKRLAGGMSQYTKMALHMFYRPFDCKNGIRLQIGKQNCCIVLFSEVRAFLGDEAALKELLQFKGASGTRLCPLCANLLDHKSDLLLHESSGTFVPSTTLDHSQIIAETNESVAKSIRFLEGKRATMEMCPGRCSEKCSSSLGGIFANMVCLNVHSWTSNQ